MKDMKVQTMWGVSVPFSLFGDALDKVSEAGLQVILKSLLMVSVIALSANAADVNVLIVGTSYDTGEYGGGSFGTSKAFDISKVRSELQSILTNAGMGTVQVSLHDFSDNAYSNGMGNKLIEEFLSKDTYFPPIDSDFWATLRGESGTDWDYVILMGEPYTIEYFPGLYTLGVSEIAKEVAKGNGETALLMTWPANGSDSSVDHYKEVVYRTGRSLGCKVVPAGLAWHNQGSAYGASHPTNDGAFLAAAAIYSRVWGVENGQDRSASAFTNGNDPLADAAHNVVKANKGAVQYTGKFTHPSDVFSMRNDSRREWVMSGMNSSTENTISNHTMLVGREGGMDLGGLGTSGPSGVSVSRNSGYNNNASMSCGFWHPGSGGNYPYTSDDYVNLIDSDLGYELRYSRTNLGSCPTYRHLPQPALWAMVRKGMPSTPFIEAQHGGRGWGWSSGAYMVTLMSGRCPMIPGLSAPTVESNAIQVGYETAWRMATLQGRAPGFKVMPSDWKRHTVDPAAAETMTVRFMFAPRQNVTVTVSTDVAWATVTPQTLTFTPQNYNTPQDVTVTLTAEAASLRGEIFNVSYATDSADEVCDKLVDIWEYTVNTLPVGEDKNVTTLANQSATVTLSSVDPDVVSKTQNGIAKQIITYSIVDAPQNGSVVISDDVATYTPDPDYAGPDSFTYGVFDGFVYSAEPATVNVTVLAKGQYNLNLIVNPSAEFLVEGTTNKALGWTGAWNSIFNKPGNVAVATAHTGVRSFRSPSSPTIVELYQDVDISDYAAHINANLQSFDFSGYGNDLEMDDARLALEFRDSSGTVLGTPYESERVNSKVWKLVQTTLQAPPNAVVARVILRGTNLNGSWNMSHFDSLSLKAIKPANSAPVAVDPPQASIAMNVPTVIMLAATDIDMNPADTLTFEIVTPPDPAKGQITGWQDGMPIYTPNQGFLGEDSFTFRVHDGTEYSANTATATILVRGNEAPSIVVHTPTTDTIYMAATNGLIFETTVTDDGGPYPSNLTISWEQTSGGPIVAVFGNPNSETTTCNWGDEAGGSTFTFRMTASDGQLETYKYFTVTVLNGGYDIPENVAPQVDVGGPYNSVAVGEPLSLQGSLLSDDGEPLVPGVTTIEWLQVSGPGTATFSNASHLETDVVFDVGGTYVLRLTGDDGEVKVYEDLTVTVNQDGVATIADVDLPAGISLYGYTGQNPIDAQVALQTLIDNNQLSLLRWVNPSDGQIKELYYTSFPSPGWVNEIGDLTLGQGYVVKATASCTLSIVGNKDTGIVNHDLPAGYSIIGFNKEIPMDAQAAVQPLIDAGKLELVRWVDPTSGQIRELYYTTFPNAGWVNEIGNMTEGQGYIIKLNAPHTGFSIP